MQQLDPRVRNIVPAVADAADAAAVDVEANAAPKDAARAAEANAADAAPEDADANFKH